MGDRDGSPRLYDRIHDYRAEPLFIGVWASRDIRIRRNLGADAEASHQAHPNVNQISSEADVTSGAIHDFFVDEAGDLAMFNSHGTSLLGREGVSRTFMLGALQLVDSDSAHRALTDLRASLLSDPYFLGVPSMQPEAGKTALCFHAKDDLPEVRREVYHLLKAMDLKVFVVVRRKEDLIRQALNHFAQHHRKLTDNTIYDAMVKTLFKNLLHKADRNHVTFARRGKRGRQVALEQAIESAQLSFERKWHKGQSKLTTVSTAVPSDSAGLQIADYLLWAVQRLFERREDRFFNLMADKYSLIIDIDDRRSAPFGRWFSKRDPLALDKIKPVAG